MHGSWLFTEDLRLQIEWRIKMRSALETPRLILRAFQPEDWRDLLEISVSKARSPYAHADFAWPTTEEWAKEASAYMATDEAMWAMEIKESGKVICFLNFNGVNEQKILDIGHVMNMEFGHRGYEAEGLGSLYDHAFNTLDIFAISAN